MERLELFDLSERFMELVNPTSPTKVIEAGRSTTIYVFLAMTLDA
ncbi:MAG: hypothetical protein R3C29_15315 [Dehalococcoidia bacterium]